MTRYTNPVDQMLRSDVLFPIYAKIEELKGTGSFEELDDYILTETETAEIATAFVLGSFEARSHLKNWVECRDRAVALYERKIKMLELMKIEL